MGVAIALGGISMMLSPQPKVNLSDAESPEETPSFLFNGVTNTTEQGNPVPVVYGEVVTGCQQIAVGLAPEDYTEQASATNPTLTVLT
jgi:predicted phage tail protein